MGESEFKVGDKIKILIDEPQGAANIKQGDIGVVTSCHEDIFGCLILGLKYEFGMSYDMEGVCFRLMGAGSRQRKTMDDAQKCSCDLRDLLIQGCKCGGI